MQSEDPLTALFGMSRKEMSPKTRTEIMKKKKYLLYFFPLKMGLLWNKSIKAPHFYSYGLFF